MVEGRLTLEEYGARLDEAFAATSERALMETLRELPARSTGLPTPKRRSWLVTLFGSVQRRGRWRAPRRILAFSLIGAPDLDFRQASVSGDVKITTISLMGALTAIVPAGIEVEVGGLALIGGNDVFGGGDQPPAPGGPRVLIRSYSLIGGTGIYCLAPGEQAALPRWARRDA